MKMPLLLAIKMVEALVPEEYVSTVRESATEYTMDLRFKADDEWSDDDIWAVSKKTGRVRELGGEEGFLCKDPVVWERVKYSERGRYVN